ncbi:MAG TPA: diacylglycerol kinase family lipid kinase [Chloroflexi bacterium]|nr:diacylglycerol kinase family lipid kinase [Chloroflexota bacterium]
MIQDNVKARLIYNPVAGPRDVRRELVQICTYLEQLGWTFELLATDKPGDGVTKSRNAAQAGCDVVLVAGGDGSVNEAVNGLVGTETALGVIPVGTGNLWAKQLGVPTHTLLNPLRLRDVAAGLLKGTVRPVDVGWVNGHHFLCWASVGLDAQVTTEMEPRDRSTKRLGALPYIFAAFMVARDFKGKPAHVLIDGHLVRGRTLWILMSNIRQYGGVFDVARDARIDDGLLDIFVFKGVGAFYILRHLVKILGNRYLRDPHVVYRQARHVQVNAEDEMAVQVDGDPLNATPVTVKVVPRSLRILVPSSAPSALFCDTS